MVQSNCHSREYCDEWHQGDKTLRGIATGPWGWGAGTIEPSGAGGLTGRADGDADQRAPDAASTPLYQLVPNTG